MDIWQALDIIENSPFWRGENFSSDEESLTSYTQYRRAADFLEEEQNYLSLSTDEGAKIAQVALRLVDKEREIDNHDHEGTNLLYYLAALVPGALHGLHGLLLDRQVSYARESMYREADSETRDRLIAMIEHGKPEQPYIAMEWLYALAWIGDAVVQKQILFWQQHPPTNLEPFKDRIKDTSLGADWAFTPEGQRRELTFPQRWQLLPDPNANPVVTTGTQDGTIACIWCSSPLQILFDLDLQTEILRPLSLPGTRLRLPICPRCPAYGSDVFLFFQLDRQGGFAPFEQEKPDYLEPDDSVYLQVPYQGYHLQPMRTPYACTENGSFLGGYPGWIQYEDYPICPQCHQYLRFIAQYEDIGTDSGWEGLFYVYLCPDCLISSVSYQQT